MRCAFSIIFCFLFLTDLFSFSHLVPFFTAYSPQEYQAGKKNWSITQDGNGDIFVGNNNCVLRYDGVSWETIRIRQGNRAVRSLYADHRSGRIYVGLFEEFGYLCPQPDGSHTYISLSDSLGDFNMHNDEIWNIVPIADKIYFQSFSSYFVYDGHTCRPVSDEPTYLYFMPDGPELYSYHIGAGLHRMGPSGRWIDEGIPASLDRIIQVRQVDNRFFIITECNGIHVKDSSGIRRIDPQPGEYPVANRALFTRDGKHILIGSIDRGLLCFDLSGELIWQIDRENGLTDNTVLNLYEDRNQNIWVALNNGIMLLHQSAPLRYFHGKQAALGSVFSAAIYDNRLFLGTNNGMFYSQPDDFTTFTRVTRIPNQIWLVRNYDDQLFIGENKHTYTYNGSRSESVSSVGGGLSMTRATFHGQELLLQGTYTQLCRYDKDEQGQWFFNCGIGNFVQPIRFVEVDYQGNIWAAHIYKGLYRLRLNRDLTEVETEVFYDQLTPGGDARIALCKVDNRVVFSDGRQWYIFNDLEQRIVPYEKINAALGEFRKCHRIVAAPDNHYWLITDDHIVFAAIHGDEAKILHVLDKEPFRHLLIEDEENIIPLGNGRHLFCLENGYMIFDEYAVRPGHDDTRLRISRISVGSGERRFLQQLDKAGEFDHRDNQITLHYSFPAFSAKGSHHVDYALNSETRWVRLQNGAPVTLQGLLPGSYTLRIRLMDAHGTELARESYAFRIRQPFYRSAGALVCYLCLVVLLLLAGFRFSHRRFEKRRKKELDALRELQEQEKMRQEQEIIRLQKEKLESEIAFKSKELANYAIVELQQKDVLKKIRTEILATGISRSSVANRQSIEKLMNTIDHYLEDNKSWSVFEQNFDLIHEKFFRNLHDQYPSLTSNDLRLCAYLRLNLTTKEIAELLHITVKGVEVARYRLRKKLGITSETSLLTFFLEQVEPER